MVIRDFNVQSTMMRRQHSYINDNGRMTDVYRDQYGGLMSISDAFEMYKNLKSNFETARGVYDTAKNIGSKVYDLASGDTATSLKNMLPNSDETGTPAYPGELHIPLKLTNGKTGIANYCGPGTRVAERISRGDQPRNVTDKICQRHDLDYTLAGNVNDLKMADKRMLDSLDRAEHNNLDHKRNILAGRIPIQSKTWAEKFKIMNPQMFSGDTSKSMQERGYSDEQVVGMESKQAQLAQEGYGFKKVYPVDKLKLLTLKKLAKEKKTLKKQKLKQLLKTSNINNLQKMLPNLSKLF